MMHTNWLAATWSAFVSRVRTAFSDVEAAGPDEVPPEVQYLRLSSASGEKNEIALVSISGAFRDSVLQRMRDQWLATGSYVATGGNVHPGAMLSLVACGTGSVGLSSAVSGQLFIATANPATLMTIGNGVGSAVMGAGGVVAQAPFVAAAGALVPVIGPLIAFQALSTIIVLKQFAVFKEQLMRVERKLERILQRSEATFVAELISMSERVADIEEHFSVSKRFDADMIIRLALAEERTGALLERHSLLYQAQEYSARASTEDLRFMSGDAQATLVASTLGLRINLLRLALSLQENPAGSSRFVETFIGKCDRHNVLLSSFQKQDAALQEEISVMQYAIASMPSWQRHMPGVLFGKRAERLAAEEATAKLAAHLESQKHFREVDTTAAVHFGEELRRAALDGENATLVYWRDEFGEHSYYTDDISFIANNVSSPAASA